MTDTDTPRALLEVHLAASGETAAVCARRARVPAAVVGSVLVGEYPRDTEAISRLGRHLKADQSSWGMSFAAGMLHLTVDQAKERLQGRILALLIQEGMSVPALAERCGTTPVAIHNAIATNRSGPALQRATSLFTMLGIDPVVPECASCAMVPVEPKLATLLQSAIAAHKQSAESLGADCGMSAQAVRKLLNGNISPRLRPHIGPIVSRRLGVDVNEFATLIARWWRSPEGLDSSSSLGFLVSRHLFRTGLSVEGFAHAIGMTREIIKGIYLGTTPRPGRMKVILEAIQASPHEASRALQSQKRRRVVKSSSYRDLEATVEGINALIVQAAEAKGVTVTQWAELHGINRHSIHRIVVRGVAPRRHQLRQPLMRALGIDRVQYDVACRKMMETQQFSDHRVAEVAATSGVHESLLKIARQGMTIQNMAMRCGIKNTTMTNILNHGLFSTTLQTKDRIRQFLRLDAQKFQEMLKPASTESVDDQDEMRLLSAFRRLAGDNQYRLLEIAGRMLANRRFDTLAR